MKTFNYVITDENGIHARPAGILVKKAASFASDIKISKDGKSADGKRLFNLMSLGVKKGETVTVEVSGADEDTAATQLEAFFSENL